VSPNEIEQWSSRYELPLAEAYELSVARADEVADRRQEKAEFVAREEQARNAITRAKQRVENLADAWRQRCQERDSCCQEWCQIWQPAGISPLSPEAMLDWLRLHGELIDTIQHQKIATSQLDVLMADVQQFEHQLKMVVGQGDAPPLALLAEARQRLDRAREAASERRTYLRELPQKEQELATARRRLAELAQQREKWEARWKPLLEQFGFPTDWNVHTANRVLAELNETRFELERAESLEKRIGDMQSGLEDFEASVASLVEALLPELTSGTPEGAVEELVRRLDEAKQNQRVQLQLKEQLATLQDRVTVKQQQLRAAAQARQDLLARAGVATESELLKLAQETRRWHELNLRAQSCEQELRIIRGNMTPADFEAALKTADKAELITGRETLGRRLELADEQFAEAAKVLGVASDKLRALEGGCQAADAAMGLESLRGELRTAVERWAPLVLARCVMRRALERFEAEHQPRLLSEVGRLFEKMTLGRYHSLARKLDQSGTLQLFQPDGTCKEPDQLSTGTREQLYLAIRLAYVLQYCQETEALPLIMDDVLVNFDDRRARTTLEVLNDVARHSQVILLTCHQHTIDLARTVDPALQPVVLETSDAGNSP
jgi:uncharacterized protein YhaN